MSEPVSHPVPRQLEQLQTLGGVAAALGLSACVAGFAVDNAQFYRSWLFGFLFWVCIPIGCLGLICLNYQTGGRWGAVIRRLCEAGTRTFPLLALLFVPIAAGLPNIYLWAMPEAAQDEILREKAPYLNGPFFIGRAALYFAIWIVLAHFLNKWSLQSDGGHDEQRARKQRKLAAAGLVLGALTVSFMAIDWGMSLDPHWFSTVYGIWFLIGSLLAAMTFCVVLLCTFAEEAPFRGVLRTEHFHDLGKLTFAFLMFWAYISFSQFLIIWSANLAEEVPWYLRRFQGGWEYLILALVVFQFMLPYALLLSQDVKRNRYSLRAVAGWLLLMRALELFWLVAPDAGPTQHGIARALHVHWMDVAAWLGIGGVWLLYYVHQLRSRPLLPLGEPDLGAVSVHADAPAAAESHA
jgi:hypothetical protein